MTQQHLNENKRRKRTQFSFYLPQANEVFLAGDFNQWNREKHPMKKGKQGTWEKILMLTPGTYEYKYIVDGHWLEDPENGQNRQNSFGSYNNFLTVAD